jgi:DNA-binding response OmpR family regulator
VTTEQSTLPILIVEDDEPTQKMLRALFRRHGYVCDLAFNGREAIALLGANRYAAVVLDIMMPEVGGKDVVAFMVAASKNVPVVICTAAGPAALTGFDAEVVKAIIRKPFDIDLLVQTVSSVIDRSAAAGDHPHPS